MTEPLKVTIDNEARVNWLDGGTTIDELAEDALNRAAEEGGSVLIEFIKDDEEPEDDEEIGD